MPGGIYETKVYSYYNIWKPWGCPLTWDKKQFTYSEDCI